MEIKIKTALKYLKRIFYTSIVTFILLYSSFSFFAYKVKEDYQKLIQSNRYVLNTHISDLYNLCMLDYYYNPNGKHMKKECNKLAKIADKKPQTPYYDFYIYYLKEFLN